jgi:hypothetical protein
MPPVNPQGSRGGLVAAVIVFTVLFVAAAIFAIYYGVQDSKAEDSLANLTSRYREIALDLTGPDVSELRTEARNDTKLTETTALAEAIRQRDDLRTIIVGLEPAGGGQAVDTATETEVTDTLAKVKAAMDQANGLLGPAGVKFSADQSLLQTLGNLTTTIANLNNAVAAANAERDRVRALAAGDSAAAQAAQQKADATINLAKAQLQQELDAASDSVKKTQDQVADAKKTFDDEQRAASLALEESDKKLADLTTDRDAVKKENATLVDKLAGRRIGVEDPIVRRPEGIVVRLADANTVYINLGQGDQILPGMTFEVYDKSLPLPKLGDGLSEEDLPIGKASLEVTRVLPNGSECHVTNIEGNQQIVQGDPILNLVYDRNVKFKFYVAGDFDIGRTGHPTAAGADVIKRLVAQWGGAVDSTLDVETDFVVVGTPPDVPVFTADDLKDPIKAQEMAIDKRAADAYDRIVQRAEELHVPIMNQNKFLYFVGFYDLALR